MKLTYDQLVEIIQRGEAVAFNGEKIVDRIEDLPNREDYEPSSRAEVRDALKAELASIQARLASIEDTVLDADGLPVNYNELLAQAKQAGFTSSLPRPSKDELKAFLLTPSSPA